MAALAGGAVVFLVAILKGAIGFGFPTVSTPVLALFMDVKTAVALLVVPNIVMDGVQARRSGGLAGAARRMATLLAFGAVGTVLGTRLLIMLPAHVAMLVLGAFLVAFVAVSLTRIELRVPPRWEPWLSPPVGFFAGVIGGLTNVPGTPLVVYFFALGLDKREFVRAVAFCFIVYKVVQLGALAWFGAFTGALIVPTLALTVVALGGFFVGLRIQDRLDQRAFNRAVLVFLGLLGIWLVARSAG